MNRMRSNNVLYLLPFPDEPLHITAAFVLIQQIVEMGSRDIDMHERLNLSCTLILERKIFTRSVV